VQVSYGSVYFTLLFMFVCCSVPVIGLLAVDLAS